jgi:transcriptional regulator with XRE-family HTH domain
MNRPLPDFGGKMSLNTHAELQQLGIGKKIRALREQKSLSGEDLAFQVKVTPVLLSQIESEVIPPTVATLLNISRILGVGIDTFFIQTEMTERVELTRHDERLSIEKPKGSKSARLNYKYEALSYRLRGKKMEPFMVEFDTEVTNTPVPLAHGGEEFCFCIEGEIEFSSDQQTIRLTPGDSLYYFSDIPHALKGIGPGVPKALFVLLPNEDEGTV